MGGITMEKLNTDGLDVTEGKSRSAEKPRKAHGAPQEQAEKQLHDFLNNEDHDEGGESGEAGEAS